MQPAPRALALSLVLVLGVCSLALVVSSDANTEDPTAIDASIFPDYWSVDSSGKIGACAVDPRIPTNGADQPPDQLIKVTDRRHRHPVFASMCSIAFLVTIVLIIVVCTQ